MGAAPAQAAPKYDVAVVAYFGTQANCQWVGATGKILGTWRDFDCDRSDDGLYRGMWQLITWNALRPGPACPPIAGAPGRPAALPDRPGQSQPNRPGAARPARWHGWARGPHQPPRG